MKSILLTGISGYIGSAIAKLLTNFKVIGLDLSKPCHNYYSHFYKVNLMDEGAIDKILTKHKIDTVIHVAAYKRVDESMTNPSKYSENIKGTINLLNSMAKFGVRKIIYSSTAAVYGEPQYLPIDEKHPLNPENYYGYTKLACEELIKWYSKIHNLKYVILRYFNVAGDAGLNFVDENAGNVIPVIMKAVFVPGSKFTIFGRNAKSPDGTCIRDYIDITDLSKAHVKALKCKDNAIVNLSTGKGVSVLSLVKLTNSVSGRDIPIKYGPMRKGDCGIVYSSNKLAEKILNWKPKNSIESMIKSTYEAYQFYYGKGGLYHKSI